MDYERMCAQLAENNQGGKKRKKHKKDSEWLSIQYWGILQALYSQLLNIFCITNTWLTCTPVHVHAYNTSSTCLDAANQPDSHNLAKIMWVRKVALVILTAMPPDGPAYLCAVAVGWCIDEYNGLKCLVCSKSVRIYSEDSWSESLLILKALLRILQWLGIGVCFYCSVPIINHVKWPCTFM